jgi:hypothetical protein
MLQYFGTQLDLGLVLQPGRHALVAMEHVVPKAIGYDRHEEDDVSGSRDTKIIANQRVQSLARLPMHEVLIATSILIPGVEM